jgi:hypothetical protein
MSQRLHPELPSGQHTIGGVAASVAAFIGWSSHCPVGEAVMVESWAEYETLFGGMISGVPLGYSVNQLLPNGGTQAYIVRLYDNARQGDIGEMGFQYDRRPRSLRQQCRPIGQRAFSKPEQGLFRQVRGREQRRGNDRARFLNIAAGFAPLYPAEFEVLQIQQMMSHPEACRVEAVFAKARARRGRGAPSPFRWWKRLGS